MVSKNDMNFWPVINELCLNHYTFKEIIMALFSISLKEAEWELFGGDKAEENKTKKKTFINDNINWQLQISLKANFAKHNFSIHLIGIDDSSHTFLIGEQNCTRR